jgi:D-galactarolactone isomerase
MHVYDPGAPLAPTAPNRPPDAPAEAWRAAMGDGARPLVVQPSHYGRDNRVTLAAAARLGGRAVVVVGAEVTEAELHALATAHAVGARFHLARSPAVTLAELPEVAARIAPLGWAVHLQMPGPELAGCLPLLRRLPCEVVIEHFGRPERPADPADPAVRAVMTLLESRRGWVKLSAGYSLSDTEDPADPVVARLARRYLAAAPERVVWGSNWPHPNRTNPPPSDDAVTAAPSVWFDGDAAVLDMLLRANPARLVAGGGRADSS